MFRFELVKLVRNLTNFLQVWFKNRRAKFRQQSKAEEKATTEKDVDVATVDTVALVATTEAEKKTDEIVSKSPPPISSADSSHSSGYSTEKASYTEKSNEELIEEAVGSPKAPTGPVIKVEEKVSFSDASYGIIEPQQQQQTPSYGCIEQVESPKISDTSSEEQLGSPLGQSSPAKVEHQSAVSVSHA